jgi:hypothetical protein
MWLTLLQINFVLGARSMDRAFRVIFAAVAIQCNISSPIVRSQPAVRQSANFVYPLVLYFNMLIRYVRSVVTIG